jgi:choline-phosphate cytidylyltransferase
MTRSRQTGNDQNGSDSGEDSNDDKSPIRGRTGKLDDRLSVPGQNPQKLSESNERAVDAQVKALLNENSKASGA